MVMLLKLDPHGVPTEPQRLNVTLRIDGRECEYVIVAPSPRNVFAIEAVCPHSGGPLSKGPIETDIEDLSMTAAACSASSTFIVCPWHSFRFNLQTGKCDESHEEGHAAKTIAVSVDGHGCLNLRVEAVEAHVVSVAEFTANPKRRIAKPRSVMLANDIDESKKPEMDDGMSWSLVDWCIRVLTEPDPTLKIKLTAHIYDLWTNGSIMMIGSGTPPDEPTRDNVLKIEPSKGKRLGKGGSVASRIAILHSLASIEQWAIDLAFDIMARFATVTAASQPIPREFFDDFLKIANDEAKHYAYLVSRLEALGSHFGALPIHAGLWESADQTSGNLLARLAVVHMVHEARGLDVNPQTISRFEKAGDADSVVLLTEIHHDEVTHVAAGQRWFSWICEREGREKYTTFHSLVRENFKGLLKPPFNEADRARAGLDLQYYMPLSMDPAK